MNIVAVNNIKGHYADGEIHFRWRLPDDAPEIIHFYRICAEGQKRYVENENKYYRSLKNSPFSERISCSQNGYDIAAYTYLIFLSEKETVLSESDLSTLCFSPIYTKTIVVGKADVYFQIKTIALNSNVFEHKITLKSETVIPEGLIVYSFNSEKERFVVPFPGDIENGKTKYEPFYTFSRGKDEDGNVTIEPVEDARSCISLTEKRLTLFGF